MTEEMLETLLRKAPAPKAPGGLEELLIAEIKLERGVGRSASPMETRSWLQRWWPGLLYGGLGATCAAMIGTQSVELAKLHRQNEALRAESGNLATLREANDEAQKLRAADADLERLRKEQEDVPRLQDEIARLQGEIGDVAQLKAENQRLKAATGAGASASLDTFAQLQSKAQRIICVNHLKQIGLAARIWANDHNDAYPTDFVSMTNELVSPTLLQCPADKSRQVTTWAQVAAGEVSYQIDATGLDSSKDDPATVVYECPFHRNVCLLDGSVQQMSETGMSNLKTDAKGRKVFAPGPPQ